MEGLTAVVLAGGKGSRLLPVVPDQPKVLAPIRGRPFLWYLLDLLHAAGLRKAVLCTGYKADVVEKTLGPAHKSMELLYSREDAPLDTGGALRLALPLVSTECVLAMNGDSYIQADLAGFARWFFQNGRDAAMLLARVEDTRRYGLVSVDEDNRVTGFSEKSSVSGPGWINAGMYLLKKKIVFSMIPERPFSMERDFFPALAGKRMLSGFQSDGRFLDIGTPESFAGAELFFSGQGF